MVGLSARDLVIRPGKFLIGPISNRWSQLRNFMLPKLLPIYSR